MGRFGVLQTGKVSARGELFPKLVRRIFCRNLCLLGFDLVCQSGICDECDDLTQSAVLRMICTLHSLVQCQEKKTIHLLNFPRWRISVL